MNSVVPRAGLGPLVPQAVPAPVAQGSSGLLAAEIGKTVALAALVGLAVGAIFMPHAAVMVLLPLMLGVGAVGAYAMDVKSKIDCKRQLREATVELERFKSADQDRTAAAERKKRAAALQQAEARGRQSATLWSTVSGAFTGSSEAGA